MDIRMPNGGQVRISDEAPRWTDWRGKQAYKFYIAAQRAQRIREQRQTEVAVR